MNKKDRVIGVIKGENVDFVPCGFSLHFPKDKAFGQLGVNSHLDFFKETDMDICKIMNENLVPYFGEINTVSDWKNYPEITRRSPFITEQIEFAKMIMDKNPDGFVTGTIHGTVASAIHPLEPKLGYIPMREMLCTHLRENKGVMTDVFKKINLGMTELALAYKELGIDGAYYASLGGEFSFFTDEEFQETIAPYEIQCLEEIKKMGLYSFLHICKDGLNMERYSSYGKSADVVNWGVYETDFSLEKGKKLFPSSTIMGGLANRSGVLIDGSYQALKTEISNIIAHFGGEKFILGADCTVPTELGSEQLLTISKILKEIKA